MSSILKTSEDNLDIYCKCIENRSGGQCQVVPGYYTKVNYEFPTCGGIVFIFIKFQVSVLNTVIANSNNNNHE